MTEQIRKVHEALLPQLKDIEGASSMSSIILSVCLIDTLAGFYCGYQGAGKSYKANFNTFCNEFLPDYAPFLHDLRNDVVHTFSNKKEFLFINDDEFNTAFPEIEGILGREIFNVKKFKSAVVNAFNSYFDKVGEKESTDIRSWFINRLKSIGIVADTNIPIMRNSKGEIIRKLEDMDTLLSGTDMKIGLAAPIKAKANTKKQ